jgi:hypothetical protein
MKLIYICLHILVLKVKGVLQNINADDWNQGQKRVPVGGCRNLQPSAGGVVTLREQIGRQLITQVKKEEYLGMVR